MRVRRLSLDELGHFRDHQVDLDAPPGALRVVVGPNEAGKSTIRAGIRAGLFGIEGSFLQGTAKAAVRVTADVTTASGTELSIVRHGGRAPRDADGDPLDPDDLAKALGVDRALYDTLFHLGHDELRRYGSALLQDDGDVGTLLFGAALGGPAVTDTLDRLDSEASALYAPRARTRRVNELLKALADADTALDDATITADHYAALVERRDAIRTHLESLRADRADRVTRRRDQERILAIGPQLRHRAELVAEADRLAAEGPRATAAEVETIRAHTASRERAQTERVRVVGAVDRLRAELASVAPDARVLAAGADIEWLAERLERFRTDLAELDAASGTSSSFGDLDLSDVDVEPVDEALADTRSALAALEVLEGTEVRLGGLDEEVAARLGTLGAGELDPDEAARLAIPSRSEIDRAASEAERAAARVTELADRVTDVRREHDQVSALLAELESTATMPDLSEVAAARARRDTAWARARGRLVGVPLADDPDDPAEVVADAVESAFSTADELADQVMSDTERATRVRAARESLGTLDQRLAQLVDDHTAAEVQCRQIAAGWDERWESLPLAPPALADAIRWHDDWCRMTEQVAERARVRAEVERRGATVRAATDRLRSALDSVGVTASSEAGLGALRTRAEKLLDEVASRRSEAELRDAARFRVEAVRTRLEAMLDLLPAEDRPVDAEAVSALRRLHGIARSDRERRDSLEARERDLVEEQAEIDATICADDGHLAGVAARLRVDVSQLNAVADRSDLLVQLDEKIDQVDRLVREAGGAHEADDQADPTDRARLTEVLGDEIIQLDEEIEAHNRELGEIEVELSRIGGGDAAAEAEARRQELLAELDDVIDDYVVLRLAHGLLEQVVADTGSGRHDELLARASELLTVLTDGAVVALEVEAHADTRHAVVVRDDGSRLYPSQLSDGTLDQLWLALRIAGIEHHLHRGGPVPVVVDDALVHFDDHRAAAAIEALSQLAERTQVICLTHHPHLVDVAIGRLGADRVLVTRLESRPTTSTPTVAVIGHDAAVAPLPPEAPAAPSRPSAPRSPATLFDSPGA